MTSTTLTSTKEQLIAVVKQGIDDFLKGNIQALLNNLTEDCIWSTYTNPGVLFAKTYKGKTAVGQFFKDLENTLNFNVFSPEKYYSDEDMVFVKTNVMATVKSTGKSYDHHELFTFKMKNGKISEFFVYLDTANQARAFSK